MSKRDPSTTLTPIWVDKDGKWTLVDRVRVKTDHRESKIALYHVACGYWEYPPPPGTEPTWGQTPNHLLQRNANSALLSRGHRYSYMHDWVGSKSKQVWYKPCVHETYRSFLHGVPPYYDIPEKAFKLGVSPSGGLWVLPILQSQLPMPPGYLLDDLAALSEKRFLDYVDPNMNVYAIAIELFTLVQGMEKVAVRIQHFLATIWTRFKQALKRGDSAWLAWNFAIRPSLRDIEACIHLCETAQKKLRHLRKVNHSYTTERYRRQNVWAPPIGTTISAPLGWTIASATSWTSGVDPDHTRPEEILIAEDYSGEVVLTLTSYSLEYVACGLVYYDLPDEFLTETLVNTWKMMNTLAGCYDPWTGVWDAFGFSWALDYWLSARVKLERWLQWRQVIPKTLDPEDPDFVNGFAPYALPSVTDTGHSWRCLSSWDVSVVKNDRTVTNVGSCVYRRYTRQYGLPSSGDPWPFRNPLGDFKKDSYGVAIATQRSFRRR